MMNDVNDKYNPGQDDPNEVKAKAAGGTSGGSGVFASIKKLMGQVTNNRDKSAGLWGVFIVCAFTVWYLVSSGDFSFLLTFAALWRCFGLLLMVYKVAGGQSAKAVSSKTLQLYGVSFLARLLSIMRHQGYLPFDKTGDWLYHVIEVVSLFACMLVLYAMHGPLKSTYDEKYDKFGNFGWFNIPSKFGAMYLFLPCVIIAMMFHPELNKEFFSDTCWTLSMYLEAVAMLPQLYMLQVQAGDQQGMVDVILGHFTFALSFSRIFELIFWIGSFRELSNSSGKLPGYIVLLSQGGQLLIMADFFYYYALSISKGVPMELPKWDTVTSV